MATFSSTMIAALRSRIYDIEYDGVQEYEDAELDAFLVRALLKFDAYGSADALTQAEQEAVLMKANILVNEDLANNASKHYSLSTEGVTVDMAARLAHLMSFNKELEVDYREYCRQYGLGASDIRVGTVTRKAVRTKTLVPAQGTGRINVELLSVTQSGSRYEVVWRPVYDTRFKCYGVYSSSGNSPGSEPDTVELVIEGGSNLAGVQWISNHQNTKALVPNVGIGYKIWIGVRDLNGQVFLSAPYTVS